MSSLKNIATLKDDALKQLVFFYELTKMGAVRFDLTNELHRNTVVAMMNRITELKAKDVSKELPCMQVIAHQRLVLYEMIVFNILKYSEN